MNKSKDFFNKLGKILEQTIVNYKDISSEIINICKSKRNDFIFKMKLTGKEETDILRKRIVSVREALGAPEKKVFESEEPFIQKLKNNNISKKL